MVSFQARYCVCALAEVQRQVTFDLVIVPRQAFHRSADQVLTPFGFMLACSTNHIGRGAQRMYGKKSLAVVGLVLIATAILLRGGTMYVNHMIKVATQYDGLGFPLKLGAASDCPYALKTATAPTRTPVVGEAMIILLTFKNPNKKPCEVYVELEAAGFDKDPKGTRKIELPSGVSFHRWSVSPKNPGNHRIIVDSGGASFVVGFTVLANQFVSPYVMNTVSVILSLLGPMATIPWWLNWYSNRQRRQNSDVESRAKLESSEQNLVNDSTVVDESEKT